MMKKLTAWDTGRFSRDHSISGFQITHMYIAGFFMLLFDLTQDLGPSEGHASHPDNGNIGIELKFSKPLPEAITCLL